MKRCSGHASGNLDFEQLFQRFHWFFSFQRDQKRENSIQKAIPNPSPNFINFGGHLGVPGEAFWKHFWSPVGSFSRVFFLVFFGRPQGRPQMAKVVPQGCLTPIDGRKMRAILVGWAPGADP